MGNQFLQNNRLLQLAGPDGAGELILTHFYGDESLSSDFCFSLDCLSDKTDLAASNWLGKAVSVTLSLESQGKRVFNGVVHEFKAGAIDYQDHRRYTLTLMPWFSALTLTKNCRIFQNLSVPQIFQKVCSELGFTDFDLSKLGNTYQPLSYLVQYNESYHQFLQRILANAGIFYTYAHTNDKHVLTLLDAKMAAPAQKPAYTLTPEHTGAHFFSWEQSMDASKAGQYRADSNVINLWPSQFFTLKDNDDSELGSYCATSIIHDAQDMTHRTNQSSHEQGKQLYTNNITLLQSEITFTPKTMSPPVMTGPQPAIVVGAEQKSIYTDDYGRIKVQFFWDRLGQKNENSSCWLRVAQIQAGDKVGTQYIPRVGDEVIVDFTNANIDEPMVIGSVYNQNNQPIFSTTSSSNVVSGLKTKLIDNSDRGHEFSFDDTPGAEKLTLNSVGTYAISSMNDLNYSICGDENTTLNQDFLCNVSEGSYNFSAENIELNVGASQFSLDSSGITIKPAGTLHLLAKDVPAAYPIARVGDLHSCPQILPCLVPHDKGPITKGSQVIMINNVPLARVNDPISCTGASTKITKGADNIIGDNFAVAHMNALSDHNGKIVKAGSQDVSVGPRS